MSQQSKSANDRQVGGQHYASQYQHWDFAEDANLGGHEWQITRYVSRHRKKNGVQDLQKAAHHLQKLMELQDLGRRNKSLQNLENTTLRALCRWLVVLRPEATDGEVLRRITLWQNRADLEETNALLLTLIADTEPKVGSGPVQPPVPLDARQGGGILQRAAEKLRQESVKGMDQTAGLSGDGANGNK